MNPSNCGWKTSINNDKKNADLFISTSRFSEVNLQESIQTDESIVDLVFHDHFHNHE
jgi:hypothetical protein